MHIPFNRAPEATLNCPSVAASVSSGQTAGGGSWCQRAERLLCDRVGSEAAMMVTSCTHALEICAHLLDLQPGDEVIVPSFTFVSSASAFLLNGARPVFADVDPHTFNLDPGSVESVIGERTRAIVVVHYAGIAADMQALGEIAERHGVTLIEDNAHGLFGGWRDRPLGSIAPLATQSFHNTKNFSCGEGGALLINDGGYREQAQIVADKGTNRAAFMAGRIEKYEWIARGSSYRLAEPLAAMLMDQFEHEELIQSQRSIRWRRYQSELADWARDQGVAVPTIPPDCDPAWHIFALLMPDADARSRFLAHMAEADIHVVFHYVPLHSSPFAQRHGLRSADCEVSERVSRCLVRLPLWFGMTPSMQDQVIEAATRFSC